MCMNKNQSNSMPRINRSKDEAIIKAFRRPNCNPKTALDDFLRLRAMNPTLGPDSHLFHE